MWARLNIAVLLLACSLDAHAQARNPFSYGGMTYSDIDMASGGDVMMRFVLTMFRLVGVYFIFRFFTGLYSNVVDREYGARPEIGMGHLIVMYLTSIAFVMAPYWASGPLRSLLNH